MKEDILINITPQETRIAIVSEGTTQELHIERSLTRGLAGNIYLGRVVRVLPGMQSAFIDIGLERAAFLHIDDIFEAHQDKTSARQACSDLQKAYRRTVDHGTRHKRPHRYQGRTSFHTDFHCRKDAGLPARGTPHRHIPAHS